MNKIVMAFITYFMGDRKTLLEALNFWFDKIRPEDKAEAILFDLYVAEILEVCGDSAELYAPVSALRYEPERIIVIVRALAMVDTDTRQWVDRFLWHDVKNRQLAESLDQQWLRVVRGIIVNPQYFEEAEKSVIHFWSENNDGVILDSILTQYPHICAYKKMVIYIEQLLWRGMDFSVQYNTPKSSALAKAIN